MFVAELDKHTIRETLAPLLDEFEENIVPDEVELLPHNKYAEAYSWMYAFEKRLKYRIERILRNRLNYNQQKALFGSGGALSEGVSNAFAHGHKKDGGLPFSLWAAVSVNGIGLAVRDSGTGFCFETILEKFNKGKAFYHIAGNGFSSIASSQAVEACYRENGTVLFLLYRF